MDASRDGTFRSALAWLVFPVVPVVLERAYHELVLLGGNGRGVPDPRDWGWSTWILQLGPLTGFAFLAGATCMIDDPRGERRGLTRWLTRRAVWVAIGPWIGLLLLAGLLITLQSFERWLPPVPEFLRNPSWLTQWVVSMALLGFLGYAWLVFAAAAVRRAHRVGRAWRAFRRGLVFTLTFLGSLFGGFWALTEAWRDYFFDSRVIPLVLAAGGFVLLSGCTSTLTYGDVRRRELFGAMLAAWTFGLALLWRWWSRPHSKV